RFFASSAMTPVAATGSRNCRRTRAFASRVVRRPALLPRASLWSCRQICPSRLAACALSHHGSLPGSLLALGGLGLDAALWGGDRHLPPPRTRSTTSEASPSGCGPAGQQRPS